MCAFKRTCIHRRIPFLISRTSTLAPIMALTCLCAGLAVFLVSLRTTFVFERFRESRGTQVGVRLNPINSVARPAVLQDCYFLEDEAPSNSIGPQPQVI